MATAAPNMQPPPGMAPHGLQRLAGRLSDVEHQFAVAMYSVWQRAKDECNYNASYFLRMLEEMSGVATAKSLLAKAPSVPVTQSCGSVAV